MLYLTWISICLSIVIYIRDVIHLIEASNEHCIWNPNQNSNEITRLSIIVSSWLLANSSAELNRYLPSLVYFAVHMWPELNDSTTQSFSKWHWEEASHWLKQNKLKLPKNNICCPCQHSPSLMLRHINKKKHIYFVVQQTFLITCYTPSMVSAF